MNAGISGPKPTAANFAFSAFLFSALGWTLIEAQLFNVAAGISAHVLATACGLGILAVALRRCTLWWSFFADVDACASSPATERDRVGDVISCIALVAAGCVLALSAKTGSLALFAICAGAFGMVPWSGFDFCRRHLFISCSMLGAGAASVLTVTGAPPDPFSYLIWAWFLWTYSIVALLTTWRAERPAMPRPASVAQAKRHNPEQATRPRRENREQ